MSGFFKSFKNVFFWDPRENGLLGILRCAMLFNFLFLLQQFGLNPYYFIFFQVIVACLFIKYCKFSMWSKQCFYHRLILSLLFIWSLFIIFNCNYDLYWFVHLCFKPYGYICILLPFILVCYSNYADFKCLLDFCYETVKVSLVILILCFPLMSQNWGGNDELRGESMQLFEVINTYIDGALLFVVLFVNKFTQSQKKVIYLTLLFSLFCSAYFGRRGVLISCILALVLSILITLVDSKVKHKFQYMLSIILIFTLGYYFVFHVGISYFEYIFGRIDDDTRSGVNLDVIEQIVNSDKFYIGRGFEGTYYNVYHGDRDGIETGYLQLILKGGLVYAILMSLYFIPAIFLGIFKTNNSDIRVCALYILLFVIVFNIASSNLSFSIRYIPAVICANMIYRKHF